LASLNARLKVLNDLESRVFPVTLKLSNEMLELRNKLEGSLYEFIKHFWPCISNAPFVEGWHLEAMCDHLEALYNLDINDLIINIPPRLGKSTICLVAFPAWIWAQDPSFTFLCTSYAKVLSTRDTEACGNLIRSNAYQKLWGNKFRLIGRPSINKLVTSQRGIRRATTIGGTNTGLGGDMIIFDDPNNAKDAFSATLRDKTNHITSSVMSSRFEGNIHKRRRLLTQQRVDPLDVTGYLLSNADENWTHVCLPEEYEKHRKCKTVFLPKLGRIWKDPRTKEGQVLWPQGRNEDGVRKLKAGFFNQSSVIRAQLQQDPVSKTGGIIDVEWLKRWTGKAYPPMSYVIQSWDTALVQKRKGNDPSSSACTTWGVFQTSRLNYQVILMDCWTGQVEYTVLRKQAIRLFSEWSPDMVVVESKVSGYSLKSDLFEAGLPVVGLNPNKYGDKEVRCSMASAYIEAGFCWLMAHEKKSEMFDEAGEKFIEAARYFPNPSPKSDTPDIIDSMSQAFIKLIELNYLSYNPNLERYLEEDHD
jgi:hypothetical protein